MAISNSLGVNSNGAEAAGKAATVETAAVKNNVTEAKLNFIANGLGEYIRKFD